MITTKKYLIIILALLFIVTMIPSVSLAAESGTCGSNLTWTLNDDGELTVRGTGAIWDSSSPDLAPWYNCKESIRSVVIESGVIRIGDYAFGYCQNLTSITIPNSVTSIGDSAFEGCQSLVSITIPDSVNSIGEFAFYNCTGLERILLPESITSIEGYTFACCSSLTDITIPNSVTTICDGAFFDCISLSRIKIPDSVNTIMPCAFEGCSGLTSIKLSNSISSISYGAFFNCSSLSKVLLPDGITSISDNAFFGCNSLTSIIMSDKINSIGNSAFEYCDNLETVFYRGTSADKANTSINSRNSSLISANWHYEVVDSTYYGEDCLYCPGCKEYYKLHDIIYEYNNDATPDTDGTKTGTCSNCGEEKTITAEGTKLMPLRVEVSDLPDKLEYFGKKDYLDVSGGKITLYYERNITRERDLISDMVSGFDNTVLGKQTLTVTVDGLTTTFEVEVIPAIVEFRDYDGSVISRDEYLYGDKLIVPDDPSRDADNTYSYVFIGWGTNVDYCTGDATYTAEYEPVYIDYTVIFKNSDGTVISTAIYHYGDTIVIPDEPEKPADVDESYVFVGWGSRITTCTGDTVYTAVYSDVIPGDATGDGEVDGLDLIRMKIYLAGADVELDESAADVTGDGKVNALDLIRLKMYLSGADVTLV